MFLENFQTMNIRRDELVENWQKITSWKLVVAQHAELLLMDTQIAFYLIDRSNDYSAPFGTHMSQIMHYNTVIFTFKIFISIKVL